MKEQWEAECATFIIRGLLTDLKACTIARDLPWGRIIHAKAVESWNDTNLYVLTALIQMYAKCGRLRESQCVFDSIIRPSVVSWNALLLGYANDSEGLCALRLFWNMKVHGCKPDSVTYVAAFKACRSLAVDGDRNGKDACLKYGREIHSLVGPHLNIYVLNTLIDMYAKCGNMHEARSVFERIPVPDVVSWNALLLGYAENGHVALDLFSRMKACGCIPNSATYIAAIKACTALAEKENGAYKKVSLERGRKLHLEIGSHMNPYLQNTLIDMYSKCGSMHEAQGIFDSIQHPETVSWNVLLLGYAENGQGQVSLDLFCKMKNVHGCIPDSVTYLAAIKACTSLAVVREDDHGRRNVLDRGRQIHLEIGCHLNRYVQNTLIDMYAKCKSMVEAQQVFDGVQNPNVVSWNALLQGYAENGDGLATLGLFAKMKELGFVPDYITYIAAIKGCIALVASKDCKAKEACLELGKEIHMEVGCCLNSYVQGTLIDMYAKFGCMVDARRVFESMQKPDVVSWNALLMGYSETGEGRMALDLLPLMKARGCLPSSVTYVALLKACTSLALNGDRKEMFETGRMIHLEVGEHLNHYVQNTLIDMYVKCGSLVEARKVFDSIKEPNVVSWNTLLSGYVELGEGHISLELFSRMKASGCSPTSVTYVAILKACISLAANGGKSDCLDRVREVHSEIGCQLDYFVQATLIDMYVKAGSMAEARTVFDNVKNPDVVCWTNLLLGYVDTGEGHVALELFTTMRALGCVPDSVTYVAAIKACALIGDLTLGRKFHSEITDFNTHVVTSLVDFYAKCGSIVEAREIFYFHSKTRDITTWTALLAGYATFGDTESVFSIFEAMQDEGLMPDTVTFTGLLLCCSHAGSVEKARVYFEAMAFRYGVSPTAKHYNCMVDLLGRANQLSEAIALLQEMPYSPDAAAWRTLLGACCKWKNVEIGRLAFWSLVNMNATDASVCILMGDIYGSRGMRKEQENVLKTFQVLKLENG